MKNSPSTSFQTAHAFTLIELLVVISIIAILAGLSFPAFTAVQNAAKKTQAKTDETQIVAAIKAYYAEYGKYPLASIKQGYDTLYGNYPSAFYDNSEVMDVLRATATTAASPNASDALNPRKVVFFESPFTKTTTNPRSGILSADAADPRGGNMKAGGIVDPWGCEYMISIDGNYDSMTADYSKYSDLTYVKDQGGNDCVPTGVFVESWGKDQKQGTQGNNNYKSSDDVISWQ